MEMVLQRSNSMARRPGPTTPAAQEQEQEPEAGLRRGPWTVDEDMTLINYIADHGEGRWNALARAAGLNRTGKSCRLRWLNYLRPGVKRGSFTAEEQLLILDLHSRWGNRWSKIAQQLPGRTDNEIKNYWRTRVQKHAKQLNCDVNSKRFKDAMKYLWMPRLVERIRANTGAGDGCVNVDGPCVSGVTTTATTACLDNSHSMVTTSSSSDSFTSESHEEKSLHLHAGERMDCGGEWMQEADHEFWSMPVQPNDQFLDQELGGWAQGFSENLWSLEDIWKMQ